MSPHNFTDFFTSLTLWEKVVAGIIAGVTVALILWIVRFLFRQKKQNGDKSVNVNVTQIVSAGSKDTKVVQESKFHGLDTYDSDLPPLIDIWVGRGPELSLLEEMKNGVVAITGIGVTFPLYCTTMN